MRPTPQFGPKNAFLNVAGALAIHSQTIIILESVSHSPCAMHGNKVAHNLPIMQCLTRHAVQLMVTWCMTCSETFTVKHVSIGI